MNIQGIKGKGNISKHSFSKPIGFTLVELIIAITILAILATIAFISFKNYSGNARDGNRMTTLKNIQTGLKLYSVKIGVYPEPENSINIIGTGNTLLTKQGIVGANIAQIIKLNTEVLDPLDQTNYIYSITGKANKYQLGTYLEENKFISYIPQTYAIDYTKRYFYTLGNGIGIILEEDNSILSQEKYSTGLHLEEHNTNLKVYFSNDTNSGSIAGTGGILIEKIKENQKNNSFPLIQDNCIFSGNTIIHGNTITAYRIENIDKFESLQTCENNSQIRTCNNGILSGDGEYQYESCIKSDVNNCTATGSYTYNGHMYNIPALTHNSSTGAILSANILENNGTFQYTLDNISCNDGDLINPVEHITPILQSCDTNYHTEDNLDCITNTKTSQACIGKPANSVYNGAMSITQTWNGTLWTPSTTAVWDTVSSITECRFTCNAGYTHENGQCIDKTPPTITNITSSSPSCNTIRFTINGAGDTGVGLHTSSYSFDGGVTWQVNNYKDYTGTTFTISTNGVQVRDAGGNIYTHTSTITGTSNSCAADLVNAMDVISRKIDTISGVSLYSFSKDGVSWTPDQEVSSLGYWERPSIIKCGSPNTIYVRGKKTNGTYTTSSLLSYNIPCVHLPNTIVLNGKTRDNLPVGQNSMYQGVWLKKDLSINHYKYTILRNIDINGIISWARMSWVWDSQNDTYVQGTFSGTNILCPINKIWNGNFSSPICNSITVSEKPDCYNKTNKGNVNPQYLWDNAPNNSWICLRSGQYAVAYYKIGNMISGNCATSDSVFDKLKVFYTEDGINWLNPQNRVRSPRICNSSLSSTWTNWRLDLSGDESWPNAEAGTPTLLYQGKIWTSGYFQNWPANNIDRGIAVFRY